jgi:NTP-dependent ternary system trypsin peptidase co-occuring protein
MSHLIEFALDPKAQTVVLVETNDPPTQGQTRVSVSGAVVEKANQAFDAALAGIKPIANTVVAELTKVVAGASEISVQFGIKLSGNAGVILASSSAEGNCTISIKWVPKP